MPWRNQAPTNYPDGTFHVGKDATEDFLDHENENYSKKELALKPVRELDCSNEGHQVKQSQVKSLICQAVRTHSSTGIEGHDFCRRKPKVPGRGGKTYG